MDKEAKEQSGQPDREIVEPVKTDIDSQEINEGNLPLDFCRFIRRFADRYRGVLEKLAKSDKNGE